MRGKSSAVSGGGRKYADCGIYTPYKYLWVGTRDGELVTGDQDTAHPSIDASTILAVRPTAFSGALTKYEIEGDAQMASNRFISDYDGVWVPFYVTGDCTITFSA